MVNAVRCAIGVQSGMIERNAGVPRQRRPRRLVTCIVGSKEMLP